MITSKQQILLDSIKAKCPTMFDQFDLQVLPSPEHRKSLEVAARVSLITSHISSQQLPPRLIVQDKSYHQKLIDLCTRKYHHPPGDPCPF